MKCSRCSERTTASPPLISGYDTHDSGSHFEVATYDD